MRHVNPLKHLARRRRTRIIVPFVLALMLTGCKQQAPSATRAPVRDITIFAPREMEPIIRAAEAVSRTQEMGWRVDLQTGGSQTLAWTIDDGEQPDLYIASNIRMAEELTAKPLLIAPWLQNQLVVIARANDPNPILHSERALERSTGPVAVGGDGTQLGNFARLALRYAEIWPLVERRTTQRSTPGFMIKSLRDGEVDHAILFASDIAELEDDLQIIQVLALPERAQIVYTQVIFTDSGNAFAELLSAPESIEQAKEAGYTPVIPDEREGMKEDLPNPH
jgi:ABC-type molybdate transport system substrate-binding protein